MPSRQLSRQVIWQRIRRSLNLCVQCGKPVEPDYSRCQKCLKKARAKHGWKPWVKGGRGRPPGKSSKAEKMNFKPNTPAQSKQP